MKIRILVSRTVVMLLVATMCSSNLDAHEHSGTSDDKHHHSQHGFHKEFKNAEEWSKKFDDPERDKWQQPDKVLHALEIKPQYVVADIGAGTGYFAIRIARANPSVKVIAADVEADMVRYLREQAARKDLKNLVPQVIDPLIPNLSEDVNLALVVDTYHHIDNRPKYFHELRKRLLPGGRIVIIDFTIESPEGPPAKHRIAKPVVVSEMKEAGLSLLKEENFLPNQYFLVFQTTTDSGKAQ